MSKLIYNPLDRIIDSWRHGDTVVTFLDNACRELEDEVADAALKEFEWLIDITPKQTEDVTKSVEEIKATIEELTQEKKDLTETSVMVTCEKCNQEFKAGTGIAVHKRACYGQEETAT